MDMQSHKAEGHEDLYLVSSGIGDGLIAAAAARNYRRCFGKPMHIIHRETELFLGNPDVVCHDEYKELERKPQMLAAAQQAGFRVRYLRYHLFTHVEGRVLKDNFIGAMCAMMGIDRAELLPRMFLTDEELAEGRRLAGENAVAVMSEGRHPYKRWPASRMQQVVDALAADGCRVVQLGGHKDIPLQGAVSFLGKLSRRQCAAVMAACRLFIGEVGFLMHLARAVDTRAVIICPDCEPGDGLYYPEFRNLVTPLETRCVKCMQGDYSPDNCDHPGRCTAYVTPEMVLEAAREELGKSEPLVSSWIDCIPEPPAEELTLESPRYRKLIEQQGSVKVLNIFYASRPRRPLKAKMLRFPANLCGELYEKDIPHPAGEGFFTGIRLAKTLGVTYVVYRVALLDTTGKEVWKAQGKELLSARWLHNAVRFAVKGSDEAVVCHPDSFHRAMVMALPQLKAARLRFVFRPV